jgi:formylglycine-generating enzyme required for sulfatase activity
MPAAQERGLAFTTAMIWSTGPRSGISLTSRPRQSFLDGTGVKTSDGFVYTSPIGKFRPNNFGLFDMIGNVAEWCSDWYDKDYYLHSPEENPPGPSSGTQHVGRGGGFSDVAGSRYRYYGNAVFRRPDWGFRVACNVATPKK